MATAHYCEDINSPLFCRERIAEMAQQDADVAEDARLRGALDVALMNFNARCEMRGFGKWELMLVKEKQ